MAVRDTYSILDYGSMINSRTRTRPWVEALRRAVRPGDVVLDIGTATGLFAFIACQAGAARVYAVDPDDAIEVAKLSAKANPGAERIEWIQAFSTDIELPERVDVIIGDLHGSLPFHTGNITSLMDARRRHLKPSGRIIPTRDVLYAVPAHAPEAYRNIVSPWSGNEYSVDFLAGRPFATNSYARAKSEPVSHENLLAEPGLWGSIDYSTVESANLDGRVEWHVERAASMHGLYVWFDGELGEGLGYSNAPSLPALPYGRTFFPLQQAVEVVAGDRVQARLSATLVDREYIYRWDTSVWSANGESKVAFSQSSFQDRPLNRAALRRAAADFVPALGIEGQIDRAILLAMGESRPLGEIAAELAGRYPDRFVDAVSALGHVARLSVQYSK